MQIHIWASKDPETPQMGPYRVLDTIEREMPYGIGAITHYGEVIDLPPFDHAPGQSVIVKLNPSSLYEIPSNSVVHRASEPAANIQFSPILTDNSGGLLNTPLSGTYSILPRQGLTVEDVSHLINEHTFSTWKSGCYLSNEVVRSLESVRYALVHRHASASDANEELSEEGDDLLNVTVACLALIRPTRRSHTATVSGVIDVTGTLNAKGFFQQEPAEVPRIQTLFRIRPDDIEMLRSIFPQFLKVYERDTHGRLIGDYEPIRMAVQLYEQAYSIPAQQWKARHILWWSAIEALFGNNEDAVMARIYALFGNKDMAKGYRRSIYDPGDIPLGFALTESNDHTLGELVPLIYAVRNESAHGQRVGDARFIPVPHPLENDAALVEVLAEAATFIIRKTLIGIVQAGYQDRFKDREARENFWLHEYGLNGKQSKKHLADLYDQLGIKKTKSR